MMKFEEKSLENLTYCNLLSKIQMILVFFPFDVSILRFAVLEMGK